MHALYRAILVAAITFGASLVGMALQWEVPADVLTASKGSVGAMVGLVTLLLALVLGFLVFTAFSVYATQQTEAQSLGPVIIELDVLLEEYGPDIVSVRKGLRDSWEGPAGASSAMSNMGSRRTRSRRRARPCTG